MKELFNNIRFYILLFSITFSVGIYFFITSSTITSTQTQIIRLEQIYALTAVIYLYLALLAGPFCYTFPAFPLKVEYLKARRALGVSAFYFALIHAWVAFFGQLGGFAGIPFLNDRYLLALTCSLIALLILSLLAATSFDAVIKKITFPRWKFLQRFVYLSGILILIHALMLGTHFSDLSETIPLLLFFFIGFLFILEGQRIDVYLHKKINLNPRFHISLLIIIVLMIFLFFRYVNPFGENHSSINIHSEHMTHSENQ